MKALITNVNRLHYQGMFSYLSYSLVCRSKLFESVIWFSMACEVIHEWFIKPNGLYVAILCCHSMNLKNV